MENKPEGNFEVIIVTLSNGHIIPVLLNKASGESWQGHLITGTLSWRKIEQIDEPKVQKI